MAKTQEELNVIKEEVEALNKKLTELTEEELKIVVGGLEPEEFYWERPEYTTPQKGEIKEGHIFKPINSNIFPDPTDEQILK